MSTRVANALETLELYASHVHDCESLIGDLSMGQITAIQFPIEQWREFVALLSEEGTNG